MEKKPDSRRGRPKKGVKQTKSIRLDMRIQPVEKKAFQKAAQIAGLDLSSWIRVRLRHTCRVELEDAGHTVPFMPTVDQFLSENADG